MTRRFAALLSGLLAGYTAFYCARSAGFPVPAAAVVQLVVHLAVTFTIARPR